MTTTPNGEPLPIEQGVAAGFARLGIPPEQQEQLVKPQEQLVKKLETFLSDRDLAPNVVSYFVEVATVANFIRIGQGKDELSYDDLRQLDAFWEWVWDGWWTPR